MAKIPKFRIYRNDALFWAIMSTFLQEFVCDLGFQDRTFSHVCYRRDSNWQIRSQIFCLKWVDPKWFPFVGPYWKLFRFQLFSNCPQNAQVHWNGPPQYFFLFSSQNFCVQIVFPSIFVLFYHLKIFLLGLIHWCSRMWLTLFWWQKQIWNSKVNYEGT